MMMNENEMDNAPPNYSFSADSHTNYTYFRHKKQSKNTENGKKQKIYNPDEISPFASFIPML